MITPSFSFKYNGVPFSEIDKTILQNNDSLVYTLPDGLEMTCKIERFPQYGVTKWTNYWNNKGDSDSGLITELFDCDIIIPFDPDPVITRRDSQSTWEPDMLQIYVTKGANVTDDDNFATPKRLWTGRELKANCEVGRSGMGTAPFFDVNRRNKGVLLAVGWTGQWNAFFNRTDTELRVRSGLEDTEFRIKPGETFRTSSVTVLEYDEGQTKAHNVWRRYVRDIVSPINKGQREKQCPFSAIFWGGVTSEQLIRRWGKLFEAGLPFDYCWIDAGWYEPLKGETYADQAAEWSNVGVWEINKKYHPNKYRDVVDYLAEHGVKMQVWMEPERIRRNVKEWTEYLPSASGPDVMECIAALNKDNVCDDMIELVSAKIREMSLSCYRQDYNIGPLNFWRHNDEPDRKGITEIKYINNLYRFWDTLLERFPHLIIDNCAGGGHRNDIEMLARSVPLWRSDYQCTWDCCPEANQVQNFGASWWYPYSGIGYGPTLGDTYSFRSAYSNGMTVRTWEHVDPEWEVGGMNEPLDWAKKYFTEFNEIRHYFACDFYPLVANSRENISWAASQYDSPEEGSGIILAFRRAMSPFDSMISELGGIDANKTYLFRDEDSGEEKTFAGADIIRDGFKLEIKNKRQSLLIRYHVI